MCRIGRKFHRRLNNKNYMNKAYSAKLHGALSTMRLVLLSNGFDYMFGQIRNVKGIISRISMKNACGPNYFEAFSDYLKGWEWMSATPLTKQNGHRREKEVRCRSSLALSSFHLSIFTFAFHFGLIKYFCSILVVVISISFTIAGC